MPNQGNLDSIIQKLKRDIQSRPGERKNLDDLIAAMRGYNLNNLEQAVAQLEKELNSRPDLERTVDYLLGALRAQGVDSESLLRHVRSKKGR